MSIVELLQQSELFSGLKPEQVERIAALGREEAYDAGDIIIEEGAPTRDIYVICSGIVEVEVGQGAIPDVPGPPQLSSIVRLGQGQMFGEMSLVDSGSRSATVRCAEDDTTLYVISRQGLWELCEEDHHMGFVVMRNVAADLSFKMRHRNLQVRLGGGEL